jgi:hypothetical protein
MEVIVDGMSEKLVIFIDSCAWDILYKHGINLSKELPADEVDLFVTKEVGSFEMPIIPENKNGLKEYVRKQMEERCIEEYSYFGFASSADPPGTRYRIGGFDEGRFASQMEITLIERFKVTQGKERKTGLYNNEADASLAVRACVGDVVLTAEKPDNGPLKEAAIESGRVVSLLGFDPSKQSLKDYIISSVRPSKH